MKKWSKRLAGMIALMMVMVFFGIPLMGMASVESVSGNETSVCICETKCTKEIPNQECPVCKENTDLCQGKENKPELLPCICETKCTKDNHNTQCPACAANLDLCIAPAAPIIVPECICTEKCVEGKINEACEICKADIAKCMGKEAEKPEAEPKYTISIQTPEGWYTKRADVFIRVKDENGTGWETVEAKINSGGSWIDLTDSLVDTDRTSLEISENCTVYVTVTDKQGKNHTKNKYIEVFDREAPTVRAGIDGELLRVEADDDLSGVERIYVCGNSFSKLDNGTLDICLKDYADEYEKITVQAKDEAGNKSRMTQLNNPFYEEPEKENHKQESSTSAVVPSGSGTTSETSAQKSAEGQNAKPTEAASVAPSEKEEQKKEKDPSAIKPTAEKETEEAPFTPDGNATVVDNAEEEQGKEFYTIMTPDENVFYLVIDKQRDSENVYFLNAVTEEDLRALTQKSEPEQVVAPVAPEEPEQPETQEIKKTEEVLPEKTEMPEPKPVNSMMIVVLAAVIAVGGIGYYLKVYKPKHELDDAEDIDDFEFGGPEEELVNEDEENISDVEEPASEFSEEEEAEQRRLYEEDQEEIPIEENSDDDLIF